MLSGVLFDIDGTLVASNEAHALAWVDVLSEAGHDVPFEVIWPMIGMGGDKVLPATAGIEIDSVVGKGIAARRWKIFERKYLPHLRPTPGARELVERMKHDGLRLVAATSAGGHEARAIMEAAGIDGLMDATTSASDAEDSKPDPDIVRAAIKKSGLPRRQLIMLGDTPYDVEAAIGAQVPLVAVLSGGWTVPELSGAAAIYDDPADLLKWYDASPFAVEALSR